MLARLFALLSRFCTAWSLLGFVTATKIFVMGRIPGLHLKLRLPNGTYFSCDSRLDQGVMAHFYEIGQLITDTPECRITRIVDAGANIGDETARFRAHHPAAVIAAIEPAIRNFNLLQKNFGRDPQVRLFFGGLWPTSAELRVNPSNCTQAFTVSDARADDHATHDVVRAFTVPGILEAMGWDEIDILKLDIEGTEKLLFSEGTLSWITRVRCFIFEVADHDSPGMTQVIYNSICDQTFLSTICGENLVLVRHDTPWKVNRIQGIRASDLP